MHFSYFIPGRFGGVGLRSWSNVADYAWYCSFADCTALEDVNFATGRAFLRNECEQAHTIALGALGGVTYVMRFYRLKNPMSSTPLIITNTGKLITRTPDFRKNSMSFSHRNISKLLPLTLHLLTLTSRRVTRSAACKPARSQPHPCSLSCSPQT